MQKKIKCLAITAALSLIMTPMFIFALNANAITENDLWGNDDSGAPLKDTIRTSVGLGNKDPRQVVAQVINVMLGFLGIIAVVIILLGGFKWMTAMGAEEKIEEAKKLMSAGIIGLLIVLAAFGIATFVINQLANATTAP